MSIHLAFSLPTHIAEVGATISYFRGRHFSNDTYRVCPSTTLPRRPNLFLIGAMKSGTTYLNKLLGGHPDVFMCAPEEPSYFVKPRQLQRVWPEVWDEGFWKSEEHYLRLFRSAGRATFVGEASTNYTKLPLISGVPERIQCFNPDARFIYLLRDPIERTISHYWHMVRFHVERRPILEAIKTDPQYLDVSNYAMQIAPYLDLFGPDRMAVVTFEQLTSTPITTMCALYQWLGINDAIADLSGSCQAENVTPELLPGAAWFGVPRYLRQSQPLRMILPHLSSGFREKASRFATRRVNRRAVDTSAVRTYLRPIQRRQTEALENLVGREFPEWTTLHGTTIP